MRIVVTGVAGSVGSRVVDRLVRDDDADVVGVDRLRYCGEGLAAEHLGDLRTIDLDGVLYQAMKSIDKRHHSTIVSRIKVMSELDIAEKRIPQDGRFKLRVKGRTVDFRVSILPTVHGLADAVTAGADILFSIDDAHIGASA